MSFRPMKAMPLFLFSVLLLLPVPVLVSLSLPVLRLGGSICLAFAVPPPPPPRKRSTKSSVSSSSSSSYTGSTTDTSASTSTSSSTDHPDDPSAFSSRYYPQSRIPFRKRRSDESASRVVVPIQKWSGLYRAYLRHRFVSQQQSPPHTASPPHHDLHHPIQFEWLDHIHIHQNRNRYQNSITPTPTTTSTTSNSKYDSLRTMCCLWNIVGNFTNFTTTTAASSRLFTATTTSMMKNYTRSTKLVALPDFDPYLVQQFVTMVQWLFSMDTTTSAPWGISYQNTVLDYFTTIPTLILTQQCSYCANSEEQDNERDDASQTTTTRTTTPPPRQPQPPTSSTIRNYDHECITSRTKSWVQRLLVEQAICPFTKSTKYSGQGLSHVQVPVGSIAYHTSQSSPLSPLLDSTTVAAVATLQSDIWWAIHDMLLAGSGNNHNRNNERRNGVSSILLAAPGWDDHLDRWTRIIFPICEATIQVLDLTEEIGVVCFHPRYQTPDGRSFPGFGHMHSVPRLQQWLQDHQPLEDVEMAIQRSIPDFMKANVLMSRRALTTTSNDNGPARADDDDEADSQQHFHLVQALAAAGGAWQRRTPHATINVLRADQLTAAESQRSTPTFYSNNILRLSHIGWSQLQRALDDDRNLQKSIESGDDGPFS